MSFKSTKDHYGTLAISLHWRSAVLILILIGSGFRAANSPDPSLKAAILRVHVPIAIAVLALTLVRIAWWFGFDQRPERVGGSPAWQEHGVRAVHLLFYVVILGMIASGIGMMVLSGAAPLIFGEAGSSLPNFSNYPPRIPHGIGAWLLVVLLMLHAGAALYHQFVRRDGLLWRMWFSN